MNDLLAGYGEATVTPPLGTELCGYGGKIRRAESVLDELKAHAVWLEKGPARLVLISCDLIGFSVEFSDTIRKQVAAENDIPMEHILLSCTHTHTGPASMPLKNCGGAIVPEYLAKVPHSISEAVRAAGADRSKATLRLQCQTITPIGFNRCNDSFQTIDPKLTTAIFERLEKNKIYMFNYACHPVMMKGHVAVSADWPGRLVQAIEKRGHHGVVFQGFCGDINPVSLFGDAEDPEDLVTLYGESMCQQMLLAEPQAKSVEVTELIGLEQRIQIPLQAHDLTTIQKEHDEFLAKYKDKPGHDTERFIGNWALQARAMLKQTTLPNVPIQRIGLGALNIIGLPGEVFCEYGLQLRAKLPMLFTVGYAGGNIGYLPTAKTYQDKSLYGWYSCYDCPKQLPSCFPFAPCVEELLLGHCFELLHIKRL
ncbi:MAG: hypothetical protein KJ964_03660 [Verrucomicrobia bacterium]|nr:hypothetical protein [Verrucomicrobiota bacterium]MBU1734919.1 hypothetical protein [Verrucomicrobiota bacterium]MBU1857713.1 hypothetical protein [Verrucomicrobiota bacterium]